MHPGVLAGPAWAIVRRLARDGVLDGWTLAGGTGLALQFGHRVSEDLDFFRHRAFDPAALAETLGHRGRLAIQDRSADTLHALLDGLRLSFLRSEAALLFPGIPYRKLRLADPRDIAVMKLVAIGGRGSRKDFVDLFVYLQRSDGLEPLFSLLRQRFSAIDFNQYHLLKSLLFFDDAESEPMPRMLQEITWSEVKDLFEAEVRRLQ